MKGKHLSEGERRQIYTLLREGYEQKEIAEKIGRPPPTVNREIKRNSVEGDYEPMQA